MDGTKFGIPTRYSDRIRPRTAPESLIRGFGLVCVHLSPLRHPGVEQGPAQLLWRGGGTESQYSRAYIREWILMSSDTQLHYLDSGGISIRGHNSESRHTLEGMIEIAELGSEISM